MSSRTADLRVVEIRCPVGPRQLFLKLRQSGQPPTVGGDNLLELSCRDCTRNARQFDPDVVRVLHRYDLSGTLVESVMEK